MGGRFGENWRFSKKTREFGWPSYIKFFRAARAAFIISLKNGGDDLAKIGDFQRKTREFGWPL